MTWKAKKESLQRNVSVTNTSPSAVRQLTSLLGGEPSATGEILTSQRVYALPAFKAGASLIADTIARTPCFLYQKTENNGRVKIDSPLADLLTGKANPFLTSLMAKDAIAQNAIWSGNGLAVIERSTNFEPVALWVLDSRSVNIAYEWDDHRLVNLWYLYHTDDGHIETIPSEDVLHIRNMGLHQGHEGVSVCDQFKDVLGLARSVNKYGCLYFKQGYLGNRYVEVPFNPTEAQLEEIKAGIEGASGLDNAHRIRVLRHGIKLGQLPISNVDSEWMAAKEASLIDVANILGIPASKINAQGYSSYSSQEQQNLAILGDVYDWWFCQIEAELNAKLLSEADRSTLYFEFERKALFRNDPNNVRLIIEQFNNRMLSWEECRELLGRDIDRTGTFVDDFKPEPDPQPELDQPEPEDDQAADQEPDAPQAEPEPIDRTALDQKGVALIEAVLQRWKRRLVKASSQDRFRLSDHTDILRDNLPNVADTIIDDELDQLQAELDAVLTEQQPEVLRRWQTKPIAHRMWN